MRFSKLIRRLHIHILLATTTAFGAFTPDALAGPALYYDSDYFNIHSNTCVNTAYRVLEENSLPVPANVESDGRAIFAIGGNHSLTAIIDCTEVASSGRVIVMVSSDDADLSSMYSQSLLDDFWHIINH